MHETARDNRVERIDSGRVAGSGSGLAPERRNVGTDTHSVHDANSLANRAAASEDESAVTGAGANRLEAVAQGLAARQIRIVTPAGRSSRVKKIELQIRKAEVACESREQIAQVRDKLRVARVERVRELVVARGPVRVVAGSHRLAALRVHDEPVGMFDHHARI